jgi:hypothetical protein
MKLTIEFDDTEEWASIEASIKLQVEVRQKTYEKSMKRYIDLMKKLRTETDDRMKVAYHDECDDIEADWKRWGVDF